MSKDVFQHETSLDEHVIVKVIGQRDDAGPGTATKQLPKDVFAEDVRRGDVIPPLYDPQVWAFLLEQSTRLKKLIDAMASNTVGLGWEIVPKKDEESFVEENKEKIVEERDRAVTFFDAINDELPFSELMFQVKTDEEATGTSWIEVLRERAGDKKPVRVEHIPSHTMRVAKPTQNRDRFVQMRSGDTSKKVFFKKFGEEHELDALTGKWDDEEGVTDPANEVIQFKLYTPRSAFYGIPRFVSAAPAIAGTRLAHRRNVAFFENDACMPLYSKILTPTGWSTMGDMAVGCEVIGSDGKPHKVMGVYPQKHDKPLFRVTFKDGSSAECTDDHVWTVSNSYDRKCGVTRNMTLQEIIDDGVQYDCGTYKWSVPLVDPIVYDAAPALPVDPYLLGYLLGNGSLSSHGISVSVNKDYADDLEIELSSLLPQRMAVRRRDRDGQNSHHAGWVEFSLVSTSGRLNPLKKALDTLELMGKTAADKSIPESYLRASIEDRISLLQGLMDSDGHVGDTAARYVTISTDLSDGVCDLVGGLGGTISVHDQKDRNTKQLTIHKLPDYIQERLCRLPGKAAKCRVFASPRWRTLTKIEYLREEHTQCIRVDVSDSLYVTDDFILTHNTPRIAIVVNGGELSQESMEMIEKFIDVRGKGPGNAGRVLLLQAKGSDTLTGEVNKVQIEIQPLTVGVTDDASFIKYLVSNNEEIREAFGIGQIFIGTSDDVNRAVALAMKQLTVEQVFEPESRRYEFRINRCFMEPLGFTTVKFRFKRPRTTDLVAESQAQSVLAAAGGATPNDLRKFQNKTPFAGTWGDTPLSILRLGLLEDQGDEKATIFDTYGDKLPQEESSTTGDAGGAKPKTDVSVDSVPSEAMVSALSNHVGEDEAREIVKSVQSAAHALRELGMDVSVRALDT